MNRIGTIIVAVIVACGLLCKSVAGQNVWEPEAKIEKLASGMGFTEGPVWLSAENLLVFSDIPNSKLMQWSAENGLSVLRESEQANGNILDLEGRLISCQHAARNVVRWDADGKAKVLADRFENMRFNSPNDISVRSDGTLWFTDPPWGLREEPDLPGHWVFKLDPATGVVEVVLRDLAMPNGINFSPDETRLYVADTGGNRRHPDPAFHQTPAGIHCFEMTADGTLGKKLFTIPHGSDGMALDVDGNLYTTDRDLVLVYDADGNKLDELRFPENPANVAFGGDDFRTLFVTARTSLYSIRTQKPGAKPLGARW